MTVALVTSDSQHQRSVGGRGCFYVNGYPYAVLLHASGQGNHVSVYRHTGSYFQEQDTPPNAETNGTIVDFDARVIGNTIWIAWVEGNATADYYKVKLVDYYVGAPFADYWGTPETVVDDEYDLMPATSYVRVRLDFDSGDYPHIAWGRFAPPYKGKDYANVYHIHETSGGWQSMERVTALEELDYTLESVIMDSADRFIIIYHLSSSGYMYHRSRSSAGSWDTENIVGQCYGTTQNLGSLALDSSDVRKVALRDGSNNLDVYSGTSGANPSWSAEGSNVDSSAFSASIGVLSGGTDRYVVYEKSDNILLAKRENGSYGTETLEDETYNLEYPIIENPVRSTELTYIFKDVTNDDWYWNDYPLGAAYERSASVEIGVVASAATPIRGYLRASAVEIGIDVAATVAMALARASSVLVGIVASATRSWNTDRNSSVEVGVLATAATPLKGFVRASSTLVGILVSATQGLIGYHRASAVEVGIDASATVGVDATRSSSTIIGILASAATPLKGFVRSSSVLVGILVSASVIFGAVRASAVEVGIYVTAQVSKAIARSSSVAVGILVTAFATATVYVYSSVEVGILVTASKALDAVRSSSVQIGVLVSALRSFDISRASSVIVGIVASAATPIRGFTRASSVLVGIISTATRAVANARSSIVQVGVKVYAYVETEGEEVYSSVIVGIVATASRSIATARTSAVEIGIDVSASVTAALARSASVMVGVLATAATPIKGFVRTASVLVGLLVSATRSIDTARSALVYIGVLVSANRIIGAIRTSAVTIGVDVSAYVRKGGRLFINVVTTQYCQVKAVTTQYSFIKAITTFYSQIKGRLK